MNEFITYLKDDHRHCDDVLVDAERAVVDNDWPTAESRLADFSKDVQRHFAVEEDVLFPAFESRTGMTGGPTHAMRAEHRLIRDLLTALDRAAQDRDTRDFLGHADTLNIMLQQHNMKEENILYPMIARTLEDGGDALLQSWRQSAPAPSA
jgi:hemerythrin-like domain-containing protein